MIEIAPRFDDQTQARIHLEAEAILEIMAEIERGRWLLITSEAIDFEIEGMSGRKRLEQVKNAICFKSEFVKCDDLTIQRGVELEQKGFSNMDALHLAAAEKGAADVFLTTDDRLLRLAKRHPRLLHVTVENPLNWLQDVLKEE